MDRYTSSKNIQSKYISDIYRLYNVYTICIISILKNYDIIIKFTFNNNDNNNNRFVSSYLIWNSYPLLGRINEIKTFKSMLTKMIEYNTINKEERGPRPEYNTLVIK